MKIGSKDTTNPRVDRHAGIGHWVSTGQPRLIKDEVTGVVIAKREAYCYYISHRGGKKISKVENKTEWKMDEYVPGQIFAEKVQGMAICRIKCTYIKKEREEGVDDWVDAKPNNEDGYNDLPDNYPHYHAPIGYKFKPTPYEIIRHFLPLCYSGRFSFKGVIQHIEVYNAEPWFITGVNDPKERMGARYFYSRRPLLDGEPCRRPFVGRKVGMGYWRFSGTKKVLDQDKNYVGLMSSFSFIMKGIGDDDTGEEKKNEKSNWIMREYFYKEDKSSTSIELPRSAFPRENLAICMIRHREVGLGNHDKDESEEDKRSTAIHEDNVFNSLMEQTFAFVDGNNQATIGRLVCHPNGNCNVVIDDHARQDLQNGTRRQAQFVESPDQRSGPPVVEDEAPENNQRIKQLPLVPGAKYTFYEVNQPMVVDQYAVDYAVTVLMNQRSSVPDGHNSQAANESSFSGSNNDHDKQEQLLEAVSRVENHIVEGQGQGPENEGLFCEPDVDLVQSKQPFEAVSTAGKQSANQSGDEASNSEEISGISPFPIMTGDCSYAYSDEFGRMNFVGWVDEASCY